MESFVLSLFREIISTVLMEISCIFLLLTLIVYVCLPVLQNLHGKTLMCHVSSLLTAFFCYTVIHWLTDDKLGKDVTLCYILGTLFIHFRNIVFQIKVRHARNIEIVEIDHRICGNIKINIGLGNKSVRFLLSE